MPNRSVTGSWLFSLSSWILLFLCLALAHVSFNSRTSNDQDEWAVKPKAVAVATPSRKDLFARIPWLVQFSWLKGPNYASSSSNDNKNSRQQRRKQRRQQNRSRRHLSRIKLAEWSRSLQFILHGRWTGISDVAIRPLATLGWRGSRKYIDVIFTDPSLCLRSPLH